MGHERVADLETKTTGFAGCALLSRNDIFAASHPARTTLAWANRCVGHLKLIAVPSDPCEKSAINFGF